MYQQHRFFIASFLAAIISLPLVFLMLLQGLQQVAQMQAKRRLEEESLQTITLLRTDLHWIKKGKELLLNKKHFDVKNIVVTGQIATVTGFYDEQETYIARLLERNNQSAGQNTWIISLLGSLRSYVHFCTFVFAAFLAKPFLSYCLFQNINYKNPFLPVLSPPPLFGFFQ